MRSGDDLTINLENFFRRKQVTFHQGAASGIREGGRVVETDLIVFMPGMSGSPWLDNTTLPKSDGGLLQADAHCRVPGWERVCVAGDAGSFPGPAFLHSAFVHLPCSILQPW
jgi:sulfide:quinone oxidoreductase